jgi:hypothetical protein
VKLRQHRRRAAAGRGRNRSSDVHSSAVVFRG